MKVTFEKSVQFSSSVVSDSLQLHEPQHAGPPCPSPTPRVHPNLCPLSRWCHPNISSSVVPFSSCPQSFPASGSFQMSQLFTWGGQSIGSFSFNISPSNEHPGLISFRMHWLDLLAVQGTLKSLHQHHTSKATLYFWVTNCWWGRVFFFRRGMRKLGYHQCTRSNERRGLGQQSSVAAETSDERLTGLMMSPSQCWGCKAASRVLTEFLDTLSYRAHCCT